jgi:hypothetical protein
MEILVRNNRFQPKLSLMYHSVMIGYIINLTIPRSGELARAAYFSRYQKTSSDQSIWDYCQLKE